MRAHKILVTFACLVIATASAGLAANTIDPELEIERVQDLYRALTSYHLLLDRPEVDEAMVVSALHDVERYVEELDNRLETDKLFFEDQAIIREISEWVAKAHLQAALLHAKGVDLERSITQFERVIEILGHHPNEWDVEIEREARVGLLPNVGEVIYEMAKPVEIVSDLRRFWSAGIVTRLRIEELAPSVLPGMTLERISPGATPFEQASFAIAEERFDERVAKGLEEFRVVLPPGRYRIASEANAFEPVDLELVAGTAPDPVVINPNTFSFQIAASEGECRPQLILNGVPVDGFTNLSFGSYVVKPGAGCNERLPDKIVVEQHSEVSLRTEPEKLDYLREGQPIFLFITTPPGSVYTLRL